MRPTDVKPQTKKVEARIQKSFVLAATLLAGSPVGLHAATIGAMDLLLPAAPEDRAVSAMLWYPAVDGGTAEIEIKFSSQLVTVTRDKAGTVIDGDPEKVVEVVDVWAFARDVGSRDPNWKLIRTESA